MLSIEERLKQADMRVARQERQERLARRQEREAKKKEQQRRKYAAGELLLKYFPQIFDLDSMEDFFCALVADKRLSESLEVLAVTVSGQCVSGRETTD